MTSLFISYSRKDLEFARRLTQAFKDQKLDFWIDWEGIPPTVDWWKEIEKGIEEADVFVFLISPDSAKSKVCKRELEYAAKNGKRLVPLVVRDIKGQEAPTEVSHLNWVFIREIDDFDLAVNQAVTAIKTDYEWVEAHRQIQVKALEWERSGYEKSFLLRGRELQGAELQIATNASKAPRTTYLQHEYVLKSRQATDRQRRLITIIAFVGALLMGVLALFGFIQANLAEQRATIARAGELAALAISEKENHFDLALLYSIEAINVLKSPRTEGVLLTLLDSHPGLEAFLSAHRDSVSSVAFSPENKFLASGSWDNTIILWDVSDFNKPVKLVVLEGHSDQVTSLQFSPDGQQLVSGSEDSTLILWDVSNALHPSKLQALKEERYAVSSVVFSPDGKHLAAGSFESTSIFIWDVSKVPNPIKRATLEHFSPIRSLAFSPDGRQLASAGSDGAIIIWDIADLMNPSRFYVLEGHSSLVSSVAFHPDGKHLLSASWDNTISFWEINTTGFPQKIATLEDHRDRVRSVAFSPDGKQIASASADNTIILWSVKDPGRPIKMSTLAGHRNVVSSVMFSPDGNGLASGSWDRNVILWDVRHLISAAELAAAKLPIPEGNRQLDFSFGFRPDGKWLASGDYDKRVILWDIKDANHPLQRTVVEGHNSLVDTLIFSADGQLMVSGSSNTVTLWDGSRLPELIKRVTLETRRYLPNLGLAISLDNELLASATSYGTVILWDINDPTNPVKLAELSAHEEPVYSLAFSSDGMHLVSGSADKSILLWNLSIPSSPVVQARLEGHQDVVNSLVLSPDGTKLISGSWDRNIFLWDISDLTAPIKLATLEGHSDGIGSLVLSPDGRRLASGSYDKTIVLWDISDPTSVTKLATLIRHNDLVGTLMFSSNGKHLLSGSADKTLIVWDLDLESWLQKACQIAGRNFTQVEWSEFFPDRRYRATCPQWSVE